MITSPGNLFSQLIILLWFPLSLAIASMMQPRQALFVIVWGGAMFLPERVVLDLPLVDLDKHALSTLCAWGSLAIAHPKSLRSSPAKSAVRWLLVLVVLSAIMTVMTNRDAQVFGPKVLPPLGIQDITTNAGWLTLHAVLPFHLGAALFRSPEEVKIFLRNFAIAGLVYMPLVLLEIRLAPWLHKTVYGFLQHSWQQMKREGGFRSIVFMQHGLAIAMFVSQSVMVSAALTKAKDVKVLIPARLLVWLQLTTLVLSKSLASLMYSLIGLPMIWLASPKKVAGAARILCLIVLGYPLFRLYDMVPTELILERAYAFSEERGQSLAFRFQNEDLLLRRALERFLFGWGGWGRNRVFDPISGEDVSTTDGSWVISLGVGGLFRFFLHFGIMVFPVFQIRKSLRNHLRHDPNAVFVGALAFVLAVAVVDLLPNALFNDLPCYMAGVLYSVSKWRPSAATQVLYRPLTAVPLQS